LPHAPHRFNADDAAQRLEALTTLLDAYDGAVRIMTVAPSLLSEQPSLLEAMRARRVVCALGHDRSADVDLLPLLRAQTDTWRMHITHAFNVMAPPQHRRLTLANVALLGSWPTCDAYDGVRLPTVELIGDGVHVAPHLVHTMLGVRAPQDLCFVTDAVLSRAVASQQRSYYGRSVACDQARGYAVARQPDGSDVIAGSSCSMLDICQHLLHTHRCTLATVATLLAHTPAVVARLDALLGAVRVGLRADFVALDAAARHMTAVVIGGTPIDRHPQSLN
jgi:N-acetylglucosamine-6-phosphate deacetylase